VKSTRQAAKGPYFRAELQITVPGIDLRAVVEEENLYQRIGQALVQVRRQLKDYKNKLKDRTQRGVRPGKE